MQQQCNSCIEAGFPGNNSLKKLKIFLCISSGNYVINESFQKLKYKTVRVAIRIKQHKEGIYKKLQTNQFKF